MAQKAVTGQAAHPMPARISAWAIYDVFDTARPDEQMFVGVVSDSQWQAFCNAFDLHELGANPAYTANNQRVVARADILPQVRQLFATMTKEELTKRLDAIGLPFAPIGRPEDLFDDPHLRASNGLVVVTMPDGQVASLPALPLEMDGTRFGLYHDLPSIDEHGDAIRAEFGLSPA